MNYQALMAYIEAVRDRPFEWGRHDCCQFAAGAHKALTGVDFMDAEYSSKEEARKIIRSRGGLKRILRRRGFKSLHPAMAQRGDVAYRIENGATLGIVLGQQSAFVGSEGSRDGLVMIPTLECEVYRG